MNVVKLTPVEKEKFPSAEEVLDSCKGTQLDDVIIFGIMRDEDGYYGVSLRASGGLQDCEILWYIEQLKYALINGEIV